jgi:hypothetical protein
MASGKLEYAPHAGSGGHVPEVSGSTGRVVVTVALRVPEESVHVKVRGLGCLADDLGLGGFEGLCADYGLIDGLDVFFDEDGVLDLRVGLEAENEKGLHSA